jgi:hypothetical protein
MKRKPRKPQIDTTLPPAAKINVYRYILPNGTMLGRPMYEEEAKLKIQWMRNEISGIDIIPVDELITRRPMVIMAGGRK